MIWVITNSLDLLNCSYDVPSSVQKVLGLNHTQISDWKSIRPLVNGPLALLALGTIKEEVI